MIKLGVTGGIGSGKSVVCRIFECLGVPVFRADEEGRRLLGENAEVKKEVIKLFGDSVITNGKPDRKKIAAIVFTDVKKLVQLNAIIHPAVRNSFNTWASAQKTPLLIEEAAILFESGAYKNVDKVLVVSAPENLRIERVMKRDKISETDVRNRMKHQWSEEEKTIRADFVLVNDATTMIIPQVLNLYKELTSGGIPKKN